MPAAAAAAVSSFDAPSSHESSPCPHLEREPDASSTAAAVEAQETVVVANSTKTSRGSPAAALPSPVCSNAQDPIQAAQTPSPTPEVKGATEKCCSSSCPNSNNESSSHSYSAAGVVTDVRPLASADDNGAQTVPAGHAAVNSAASNSIATPGTALQITTEPPFKRLRPQPFSHLLVCDFEATCAGDNYHYPHEIIEFPVVAIDVATLKVVATFHRYVRPLRNRTLTSFCTDLTGITQTMVDAASPLSSVVAEFQQWLVGVIYPLCQDWLARYGAQRLSADVRPEQRHFVYDESTEVSRENAKWERMICMATDGPWDMRRFMHECSVVRDGVAFPPLFYRYINVRHCFAKQLSCAEVKLTCMIKRLGMKLHGRHHSGIHDTMNIARILAELLARGYRVHHVSTIKYQHCGDAFLESNIAARELLSELGEQHRPHRRPTAPANQKTRQSKRKARR